jgi:hypothetical protein
VTRRFAAVILVIALFSGIARAAPPGVILGVLEESPGLYAGSANFFKVRMAFIRRDGEWRAWCTQDFCPEALTPKLPEEAAWNVGFSGRYLGEIPQPPHAEGPEWTVEDRHVPTIGKPSREFGGFLDSPVYRPLIVSSRRQFSDPDGWKRGRPSAKQVSALRAEFAKKFPEVDNCDRDTDEQAKPWHYKASDIRVTKFYASRGGWSVASLALSPYRCDGPVDDAFDSQLFAISPAGQIQYLDQGLWLVDAGDYDGDGKSELVFAIDRYDAGGYALYYGDFSKHATASFHYH